MNFNKWFNTLLKEKEIDLSESFIANDGSTLFVGDICSNILSCSKIEQFQIKTVLVMIDFKNGDISHYLKHLGKALNKSHRIKYITVN